MGYSHLSHIRTSAYFAFLTVPIAITFVIDIVSFYPPFDKLITKLFSTFEDHTTEHGTYPTSPFYSVFLSYLVGLMSP